METPVDRILDNLDDQAEIAAFLKRHEPLIQFCANRYIHYFQQHGRGPADMEDLMQAGRCALIDAATQYNANAGKSWTAWAMWFLSRAMSSALGFKSYRNESGIQKSTPEPVPVYLDAPLDDDGGTLAELLPDVTALSPEECAELSIFRDQVRSCVEDLDAPQAGIIKRHDLAGESLIRAGAELGMDLGTAQSTRNKGFRKLRKNRVLIRLHEDFITGCYHHRGISRFNSTGTSIVESTAIRHIELCEYYFGKHQDNQT